MSSVGRSPGGTIVLPNATARIANAGALSVGTVTVYAGGELQVAGIATLANPLHLAGRGVSGTGVGALEWDGANVTLTQPLTLDASAGIADPSGDGHSLTLAAGVTGTGALSTTGTVVLPRGQSATNTLGLAALGGTLQVDGSASNQMTANAATVDGSGSASGIAMGCNSTLSPGDAGPGVLTTTSGLSL